MKKQEKFNTSGHTFFFFQAPVKLVQRDKNNRDTQAGLRPRSESASCSPGDCSDRTARLCWNVCKRKAKLQKTQIMIIPLIEYDHRLSSAICPMTAYIIPIL